MKLAIFVRKDLGMGIGKTAVQVGHTSILAYISTDKKDDWINEGQKKIVLKVNDEASLLIIEDIAKSNNVQVIRVYDLGLTQIAPNTLTCIAIGPDSDEKINNITKGWKLY